MREIITFECTKCKSRNYTSTKNKKTTTERLEPGHVSYLQEGCSLSPGFR